jgi:hypothetical protein
MNLAARSLRVSMGIVVWAAHFAAIYGFTALGCARGFEHLVPRMVVGASIVAGALLLATMARGWIGRAHVEHWLSGAIAAFAFVAVVFETIPAWAVPTCA